LTVKRSRGIVFLGSLNKRSVYTNNDFHVAQRRATQGDRQFTDRIVSNFGATMPATQSVASCTLNAKDAPEGHFLKGATKKKMPTIHFFSVGSKKNILKLPKFCAVKFSRRYCKIVAKHLSLI
jgi:hypothetical protein